VSAKIGGEVARPEGLRSGWGFKKEQQSLFPTTHRWSIRA